MKKIIIALLLFTSSLTTQAAGLTANDSVAVRNVKRAVTLLDATMKRYYNSATYAIAMDYDPAAKKPSGEVSVWEYTAALEAVNSVLEGLETVKDLDPDYYSANHDRFVTLLSNVYQGMQRYKGTFSLPSYTGVNEWKVYTVNKGADPAGDHYRANVYDDQMWISELLRAYKLTDSNTYLNDALSLTLYVHDGWDCTLDPNGREYGGITWGPGYTSKHACSNAPFISPLVWLSEKYATTRRAIKYYVLNAEGTRELKATKPGEFYRTLAEKLFKWQNDSLYNATKHVYWDMRGGKSDWHTETIDGVEYRRHVNLNGVSGKFYTYNTGTMISGAADLFRLTGDSTYYDWMKTLSTYATMNFTFRKKIDGTVLHSYKADYATDEIGRAWFNDVLIRGLIDVNLIDSTLATRGLNYAQQNLDFAYDNNLVDELLPNGLIIAGSETIPFQQEASFISIYAQLAKYQVAKNRFPTGIATIPFTQADDKAVYDLTGCRLPSLKDAPHGIYIVGGKKVVK